MSNWVAIPDDEVTIEAIHDVLEPLLDDLWVVSACADRVVDDPDVEKQLLNVGLKRSGVAVNRVQLSVAGLSAPTGVRSQAGESCNTDIRSHFTTHPEDEEMCRLRRTLLERLDRLLTYQEMVHVEHWCIVKSESSQNR